jgi:MobA-like NTP transferase domain
VTEKQPTLVMLAAGMAKRYGGCKPLAPVGIHGEAIIDLTASDALSAGFGRVVIVVGPKTEPAIGYHVERTWPQWVDVATTLQSEPLGTAHAAVCAKEAIGDGPFALVNGDDVYGAPALAVLHDLIAGGENALVAFPLAETVLGSEPVTRGVCLTDSSGALVGLSERRQVSVKDDGTFTSADGLEPSQLAPDTLVSMNLWGFQPDIWKLFDEAVTRSLPGLEPGGEVLLPEVVGEAVADGTLTVKLTAGPGRCVGVTHADDLPVARSELARMVGRGERAEWLWERPR